ncbi:AAA family ATPase [Tissierella sp. MB52-C2]|uniref:AAA family ATPase n=1 Tax=Tissierella sp. MB52-C2 TaxID=3070999 RepID=UPI00280B04E8|nr:AAA family ATPase [Tissierella sp. MB52-C2]WMM24209.1 AAA family ATPase [Tissierella sp. MB52-C2]
MILTLNNIGKIEKATVELNGITIIAGENNTGKSTVGKTLFCIFNSFYKIEEQIQRERKNAIRKALDIIYNPIYRGARTLDIEELIENLIQNSEIYKDIDLLKNRLKEYLIYDREIDKYVNENFYDSSDFESTVKRILQIVSIPDEEILKTVLSQKFNAEFNNQINNIYSDHEDGIVELKIKDTNIEILIQDNEVKSISKNLSLNTEVIYIDDPFVLDEIRPSLFYLRTESYANHRLHLQSKLRDIKEGFGIEDAINKIIVTEKMMDITSKIDDVCSGKMIKSSNGKFGYKENNLDKVLDIKNISTGLKTFVILKTLLLNGSIEDNGTIVLDEPEIHLHPEWQILFAEIIVLLQKKFNMHILLNTHSPYFLRAIQVYSAKYEIADKCNYYLAENIDDRVTIRDVTTSIDEVYAKLAKPFEILEIERYGDD